MKYYRVKKEYDNKTRYIWKYNQGRPDGIIISGELYTPAEFARLAMCPAWFEVVEIPKNKIYWFLGARFAE